MSARVVPFPLSRRTRFVQSQARSIAALNETQGARHLRHTLDVQRQALCRRGIDPALIERELKCLETAIKAKLWSVILTGGDSA